MASDTIEKDDKIERGERLKYVRHSMAKMTREELEKYDLSAETLKNWELGRSAGLTEKGARRIVTIFREIGIKLSIGWLLRGEGSPPAFLEAFIHNKGVSFEEDETTEEEISLPEEITTFCKRNPGAIYMKVVDDGMEPHYRYGDYVAGKRYYRGAIQEAVGQDCIVETQKGETLLRRVREGTRKGYYTLLFLNMDTEHPSQFLYEAELISAAPVSVSVRPIR